MDYSIAADVNLKNINFINLSKTFNPEIHIQFFYLFHNLQSTTNTKKLKPYVHKYDRIKEKIEKQYNSKNNFPSSDSYYEIEVKLKSQFNFIIN